MLRHAKGVTQHDRVRTFSATSIRITSFHQLAWRLSLQSSPILCIIMSMRRGTVKAGGQNGFFDLGRVPDDSVERSCIESGYTPVAGIDEAGRGPLAGPVVAAAVILPHPCPIEGLRDSKALKPEKREELYEKILSRCICHGIGISSPDLIDEVNILQATLIAMRAAVAALEKKPQILLVDGISRIPLPIPQKLIKKGDGRCVSIAAASILAKVTRDRIMQKIHSEYPEYGFSCHFGYGTREHLDAITRLGPCPVHRKTFRGVKEVEGVYLCQRKR